MEEHNCSIIIIRTKIADFENKKHLTSKIDEIRNDCKVCTSLNSIKDEEFKKKIFNINKSYIMKKTKESPGFIALMLSKDLITFLKSGEVYFSYFDEGLRTEFNRLKILIKKYNLKNSESLIDLLHENKELDQFEVLLIKKILRKNSLSALDDDLFK